MTDKEWEEFVAWWERKWPAAGPHRASVEQYIKFLEEKRRNESGIICQG
ncbi:MAG TPA: hypothetical protein VMV84_04905 [Dehalococcoidales bacterium]|nr:hypothetical protein [Dehalococcoidales bacterium]